MISPQRYDPYMQEISNYDENQFSDLYLSGSLPWKKKDSFLGE